MLYENAAHGHIIIKIILQLVSPTIVFNQTAFLLTIIIEYTVFEIRHICKQNTYKPRSCNIKHLLSLAELW